MQRLWIALSLAMASLALGNGAAAHDPHARYIGNEGVMVVRGETKILFDAFYAESYGRYVVPSADEYVRLNEGRPPFDGVDAVFVSHVHGDHFTPQPVIAYLRAQPDVRLYGPTQMVEALRAAGAEEALLARVSAFDLAPGDAPQTARLDGIAIDAVALPHAGGARMAAIRNLIFRVEIDDLTTVMHLGDAAAEEANFAPQQAHWDAKLLDLAMPPYWFYASAEGRRILEDRLKARQSIGIHVPAEAVGDGDAWRARIGGDLFTDPGETRQISSPD